ncbi:MAG TPA: zinc-binding dehydrogenase [Gemmatimonadales bacterium]|jgi:NADPH:quinone reductase-like Zn-dependent oxidoreductase|nr:zinc-binding dehydrogenase [Gemmatimonadales bacterium]
MRALALAGVGGLDQLAVRDVDEPALGSALDVKIRIHAAALNRLDLFVVQGLTGVEYQFPHVIGSDGAGVVEAVGAAVGSVRPGDRVMINPALACDTCQSCLEGEESLCRSFRVLGEHVSGTIAEFVVLPEGNVARVPETMPTDRAAAFSLATLTAWRMLTTRARLRPGETVLIWGIGGGVAQAALQIAKLLGANAVVTSGEARKLDSARALGADAVLDHSREDVVQEVKRLTGGRGADVVVDSVGERTWAKSLRALRRGGRMVVCGATTGPMVDIDLRRLFWHQWTLMGSTMGSRREYREIVRLAGLGHLWPVVDRVVPLTDAVDAFHRLENGEQFGKLVIEVAS